MSRNTERKERLYSEFSFHLYACVVNSLAGLVAFFFQDYGRDILHFGFSSYFYACVEKLIITRIKTKIKLEEK